MENGEKREEKNMTMKEWLAAQITEALGETNRWYFHEHYNRDPLPGHDGELELIEYYAAFGAKIFSELHQDQLYVPPESKEQPKP